MIIELEDDLNLFSLFIYIVTYLFYLLKGLWYILTLS
jgi:hypothetical protein